MTYTTKPITMSKIISINDYLKIDNRLYYVKKGILSINAVMQGYAELVRAETLKEVTSACKKQAETTDDNFPLVYQAVILDLQNSPNLEIK